jgi:hypothetical protein
VLRRDVDDVATVPSPAWLLAGLSAAAGVLHFSVVLEHTGGDAIVPIGFALAGWSQLLIAGLIVARRATRGLYVFAMVANLVMLGIWAWSRTAGLPFDPYGGVAEDPQLLDITVAVLEAAAVVVALAILLSPRALALPTRASMFVGLEVLAIATLVLVVPDGGSSTAGHSHGGAATATATGASSGHSHGGGGTETMTASSDHASEMVRIDRSRCDLGFNPQAYWDETAAMNIDSYAGGTMSASEHAASASGDVARVAPLGGRGSVQLDKLVSLTSQASGEAASAQLVVELGKSDDETYDAWRQWMATQDGGSGDHHGAAPASSSASTATPAVPTMGHAGPSPWKAMVDPTACQQLSKELELARQTALKYPTVQDAVKAGWFRVTPYVPGIAAHYMKFSIVDEKFDIEQPEMILYDGTDPNSRVIGLSYYIRLDGTAQPTQGFTGDNDHYHRHLGLCIGRGGVIGDSTTTDEQCAEMGGAKAGGTDGWMSHAWVVPGCESPWGVFSAVNPLLDDELQEHTGENDGGCSAAGVRNRYDLSPGSSDLAGAPDAVGVAAGK